MPAKPKSTPEGFTEAQIGVALNNALVPALNPERGKPPSPARRQKLREYTKAIIELPVELAKEGHYSLAELRQMLLAGALYVHVLMGNTERLPLGPNFKVKDGEISVW